MTKQAKDRAESVRSAGVVKVKKSGAVCVDWSKAVKSDYLKETVDKMSGIKARKRA